MTDIDDYVPVVHRFGEYEVIWVPNYNLQRMMYTCCEWDDGQFERMTEADYVTEIPYDMPMSALLPLLAGASLAVLAAIEECYGPNAEDDTPEELDNKLELLSYMSPSNFVGPDIPAMTVPVA